MNFVKYREKGCNKQKASKPRFLQFVSPQKPRLLEIGQGFFMGLRMGIMFHEKHTHVL